MDTQYVNIYEVDREYGGPEEGGWWFTSGTLVHSEELVGTHEAREARLAALESEYPYSGDSGLVNYDGGDFHIYVEDAPGASYFPEERPRYE